MIATRLAALILASGLFFSPISPAQEDGGWWGDLYQEKVVALERILASPEGFRGANVTFIAQYHRAGRIDNPFHTRFERNWYMNFSMWPDGAPLWKREVYKKDYPYLFIRRSRTESKELASSGTYSRWLVHGNVSEIIDGKPWIEVKAMKRLPRALDEASLVLIVKALRLKGLGKHEAAAAQLRDADHEELPAWARTFALREEATALMRTGKPRDALVRARSALSLIPKDKVLKALVKRLEQAAKKAPAPVSPREAGGDEHGG